MADQRQVSTEIKTEHRSLSGVQNKDYQYQQHKEEKIRYIEYLQCYIIM